MISQAVKGICLYVESIAAHCSVSGFNYAFHVNTHKNTVIDMLLHVCKKIPSDDGSSCIAIDIFYTTVDNYFTVYKKMGNLQHGSIRSDQGPLHCGIYKPRLGDGEYVHQYYTLPFPMAMYLWRDSINAESWFISMRHDGAVTTVFR